MENHKKLAAALTVIAALSMSCATTAAPAPSSSPGGGASGHAGHSAPTAPAPADHGAQPAVATYTCPMHPEVREAKQGRCLKCGMSLMPAAENKAPSPAPPAQPSHDGHAH